MGKKQHKIDYFKCLSCDHFRSYSKNWYHLYCIKIGLMKSLFVFDLKDDSVRNLRYRSSKCEYKNKYGEIDECLEETFYTPEHLYAR